MSPNPRFLLLFYLFTLFTRFSLPSPLLLISQFVVCIYEFVLEFTQKRDHTAFIFLRLILPGDLNDSASGPCSLPSILPGARGTKGQLLLFFSPSVVSDSATPWTVARQAPLSMRFSRQEHWSGLPFPSPGGLPNPGIKPGCPALQADSLLTEGSPCLTAIESGSHNYWTHILQLLKVMCLQPMFCNKRC